MASLRERVTVAVVGGQCSYLTASSRTLLAKPFAGLHKRRWCSLCLSLSLSVCINLSISRRAGSDLGKQREQIGADVTDVYDYSFSENGLVGYKGGELIHTGSMRQVSEQPSRPKCSQANAPEPTQLHFAERGLAAATVRRQRQQLCGSSAWRSAALQQRHSPAEHTQSTTQRRCVA